MLLNVMASFLWPLFGLFTFWCALFFALLLCMYHSLCSAGVKIKKHKYIQAHVAHRFAHTQYIYASWIIIVIYIKMLIVPSFFPLFSLLFSIEVAVVAVALTSNGREKVFCW